MTQMRKQAKQMKYSLELYEILREVLLNIHGPLINLRPIIDRAYALIDLIDNEAKDDLP